MAVLIGLGALAFGLRELVPPLTTAASGSSTSSGASQTATATGSGSCPAPVSVVAEPGSVDAVTALAEAFEKTTDDSCPSVAVSAGEPGADKVSVVAAGSSAQAAATGATAIGGSPLVLAMPKEMATLIGWPDRSLDTATLQKLVLGETTWAGLGHADWGRFRIQSPDPQTTEVGQLAFAGLASIANGALLSAAPNYAYPSRNDLAVIKLENAFNSTVPSLAESLPDTKTTLADMTKVASAFVTTEAELGRYNAATPTVPMSGFYIGDGGVSLPVLLSAPADLDAEASGVVANFRKFAVSAAGQEALRGAGVRSVTGEAPTALTDGVNVKTAVIPPQAVSAATLAGIEALWTGMHQRISTLALIDLSGSMNQVLPGGDQSKIDILRSVAETVYRTASPNARSGIWFFHTDSAKKPLIDKPIPLEPNDTVTNGVDHATAAVNALKTAKATGDTPLYEAIKLAYAHATEKYDPDMVNQVLVLSDGKEDSTSKVTLDDLLAYLKATYNPDKEVRIILLALEPKDNLEVLQQIAKATNGKAVGADTLAKVPDAVVTGIFSGN